MRRWASAVLLGLVMAGTALADGLRNFPEGTQLATLKGFDGANVRLGSKVLPVAPGLQIRDQQNLIVLPASVLGDSFRVPVRVQFDTDGAVWRIWILTPEEAKAL